MSATRKHYSTEFKADAVALVASSGNPVAEVARDLGVNDTTLCRWVRDANKGRSLTKPQTNHDDEAVTIEIKRLKKRIAELEVEREILKRATAFWVKESNG